MSADLPSLREQIAGLQGRLHAARLTFRSPPPEPTTCCGKGCQGCVWEGFYAASAYWLEGARGLLAEA